MGAALSVTPFRRLKLRPVRMPRTEFHPTPRSVIDMARAMAAALAGSQFGTAAEAWEIGRASCRERV